MSGKKTYVDAGVLIAAVRGKEDLAERAMQILDDPNRTFVSSPFLKLEVLPKAVYGKRQAEVEFYETFFAAVLQWADALDLVIKEAQGHANTHGLGAMDALHVAAAISIGADELVTTERREKPIHRVQGVHVISVRRESSNDPD
jgi:predicted nucleic acid-binding protein